MSNSDLTPKQKARQKRKVQDEIILRAKDCKVDFKAMASEVGEPWSNYTASSLQCFQTELIKAGRMEKPTKKASTQKRARNRSKALEAIIEKGDSSKFDFSGVRSEEIESTVLSLVESGMITNIDGMSEDEFKAEVYKDLCRAIHLTGKVAIAFLKVSKNEGFIKTNSRSVIDLVEQAMEITSRNLSNVERFYSLNTNED